MTCFECNLQSNRIGKITAKDLYKFKLSLDETMNQFKVTGKDGHIWGQGASVKGAMISAMNCGVQLRDIDISEFYVPIPEVIKAVKS